MYTGILTSQDKQNGLKSLPHRGVCFTGLGNLSKEAKKKRLFIMKRTEKHHKNTVRKVAQVQFCITHLY